MLRGVTVEGNGLTLDNDIRESKGPLPAALNSTCVEQREPAVLGFIHRNSLSELLESYPIN